MMRSILQCRKHLMQKCFHLHHIKIPVIKLSSLPNSFDFSQPYINFDDQFILESNRFRNTLYPDTIDPILSELKSCNSMQQVFDIFLANKNNFSIQHLCQSVLVLRDIQKVFNKFYMSDNAITHSSFDIDMNKSNCSVFQQFQNELLNHEHFKELLSHIDRHCTDFDINEAVCTILYLRYLGLSLNHDTVQRLLNHADKTFRSLPPEEYDSIFCSTLSRYFSCFKHDESLYSLLSLSKLLPLVIAKLGMYT